VIVTYQNDNYVKVSEESELKIFLVEGSC